MDMNAFLSFFDQSIIRIFNLYLHFFQFNIQVLVALLVTSFDTQSCSSKIQYTTYVILPVLFSINIAVISVIKFNKFIHFITLFAGIILNFLLLMTLLIIGFSSLDQEIGCADAKILHRFIGFEALICLVIMGICLVGPYDFSLRYTNTPSNFVWVFLIFSFQWTKILKGILISIGISHLLITISNLSAHLIFLIFKFKRPVMLGIWLVWIVSVILMVVCQILMIFVLVFGHQQEEKDIMCLIGKKVAKIYIFANIFDLAFGIFSFLTLKIRSGGSIYTEALSLEHNQIY